MGTRNMQNAQTDNDMGILPSVECRQVPSVL